MLRGPEASGASPNEFKGVPMENYERGARIVINRDGKWVEEQLKSARVAGDGLELELKNGTKLAVDYPPTVLEYRAKATIEDEKLGGKYRLSEAKLTADGRVEYDVTEPNGEVTRGVPQELLKSWEESLDLEKKLERAEEELDNLSREVRGRLQGVVDSARAKLEEAFNKLPATLDKMSELDRRKIESLKNKLDGLRVAASAAVDKLEKEIESAVSNDVNLSPMAHKETTAEKAEREAREKSEHESNKEFAQHQLDELERKTGEAVAVKQKEVKQAEADLDDLNNTLQSLEGELSILKNELTVLQKSGGRQGRQSGPPRNQQEITAKRGEVDVKTREIVAKKNEINTKKTDIKTKIREIDDAKKAAHEEFYRILVSNLPSGHPLKEEIDRAREKMATNEVFGVKTVKRRIGGKDTEVKEYKDQHVIQQRNMTISEDLLKRWAQEGEYAPTEKKYAPESRLFDFEAEVEDTLKHADDLIAKLPQDADGRTNSKYLEVYNSLVRFKRYVEKKSMKLATTEKAKKAKEIQFSNEIGNARQKEVEDWQIELRVYEKEIEKIRRQEKASTEREEVGAREIGPIDLSRGDLVGELLKNDEAKVKEAIRTLYLGGVDENGKLTPAGLAAMRDLFGAEPPDGVDAQWLRAAGIKDWKKFKRDWDMKLASETGQDLALALQSTLARKLEEKMNSFGGAMSKLWKMKGQVAGRVAVNAALIGASVGTMNALVNHAVDYFEAAGTLGAKAAQGAGATSGGMLAGVVKWFTGKKFFGNAEKNAAAMEAVRSEKKKQLVEELLKEGFDGGRNLFDGRQMFGNVLSESVVRATAKEIEVGGEKLSGRARVRFEDALARLDVNKAENRDADKIKQLAKVFSAMNRNGDSLMKAAESNLKPQAENMVDKFLQFYSGRGNIKQSILTNAFLSGVFICSSEARMAFGAAMGAYGGWKAGEAINSFLDRREGKKSVEGKYDALYDILGVLKRGEPIDELDLERFRNNFYALKGLLHGKGTKEELATILYMVDAGKDANGNRRPPVPMIDETLLRNISVLVNRVETETNILYSRPEEGENEIDDMEQIEARAEKSKADLARVLAAMQEVGQTAMAPREEKTLEKVKKALRRFGVKAGATLAGAGVVGASYLVAGPMIQRGLKNVVDYIRGLAGAKTESMAPLGAAAGGMAVGQHMVASEEPAGGVSFVTQGSEQQFILPPSPGEPEFNQYAGDIGVREFGGKYGDIFGAAALRKIAEANYRIGEDLEVIQNKLDKITSTLNDLATDERNHFDATGFANMKENLRLELERGGDIDAVYERLRATVGYHEGLSHALGRQFEDKLHEAYEKGGARVLKEYGFKGDINNEVAVQKWAVGEAGKLVRSEGWYGAGKDTWVGTPYGAQVELSGEPGHWDATIMEGEENLQAIERGGAETSTTAIETAPAGETVVASSEAPVPAAEQLLSDRTPAEIGVEKSHAVDALLNERGGHWRDRVRPLLDYVHASGPTKMNGILFFEDNGGLAYKFTAPNIDVRDSIDSFQKTLAMSDILEHARAGDIDAHRNEVRGALETLGVHNDLFADKITDGLSAEAAGPKEVAAASSAVEPSTEVGRHEITAGKYTLSVTGESAGEVSIIPDDKQLSALTMSYRRDYVSPFTRSAFVDPETIATSAKSSLVKSALPDRLAHLEIFSVALDSGELNGAQADTVKMTIKTYLHSMFSAPEKMVKKEYLEKIGWEN